MRDGKSMGNIPQATPAEHRRKSLGGSHGRLRTLKIAGGFPHAEAMIRYSPEYNRQTILEEWSVLPGNCAETPVVEIESRVALSVPQADFWGVIATCSISEVVSTGRRNTCSKSSFRDLQDCCRSRVLIQKEHCPAWVRIESCRTNRFSKGNIVRSTA